jgi:hypothetical protein
VNLLPEHAVVRVEDLLDEEEEELLGDAARVLRLLAHKLHPQRFLQVTRPNHRQLQPGFIYNIYVGIFQCCGAENISFDSGSMEPQIRIS